jgi:hypothetical protein
MPQRDLLEKACVTGKITARLRQQLQIPSLCTVWVGCGPCDGSIHPNEHNELVCDRCGSMWGVFS